LTVQAFKRYAFEHLKSNSTPFAATVLSVNQSPETDEDRAFMQDKRYAEILEGIQFGQGTCRLDITLTANALSRFLQNLGCVHWNTLVHLVG
jgi:hypothetical protein